MTTTRRMVGLYVALVFASGLLVGVVGQKVYSATSVRANSRPSPEEFRKRHMEEMQTRLNLSPQQLEQFGKIMDETGSRFKALREDHTQRVNAMLDQKQRAEYEVLMKEREERKKRGRH
ncbi:MAG TPA: hypothetical protein DEH78_32485 [Solibacterales bacterium]|nr:hypothetical protein [Bryobacterales bacterium]